MIISRRDYELLNGLHLCGQAFVGASEASDAMRLNNEGLVATYAAPLGVAGYFAWKLTEKGRQRVEQAKADPELIVEEYPAGMKQ